MLKSVHVYHTFSPDMGGSYTSVVQFLKVFNVPPFSASVITFNARSCSSDCGHEGFDVCVVPVRDSTLGDRYRLAAGAALREAERVIADAGIVFVHLLYRHHAAWAAQMAGRYRKPLVVVPHGGLDPYCFTYRRLRKRLWLYWYRDVLLKAGHFLFATDREAEKAQNQVGPLDHSVIFWPCRLVECEPSPEVGRKTGPRRFLLLARLDPMKRVLETVAAFAGLKPSDAELTVIGPASAEITQSDVRRAAGPLFGKTVFYQGSCAVSEVAQRCWEHDALVLFSKRENFGHSVAEAMACQRPVFISEDVDLAALVKRQKAGCAFAIRDTADIAAAFRVILSLKPEELRAMGVNARKTAVEHFDFRVFQERLVSLAQSRIDKAGGAASG